MDFIVSQKEGPHGILLIITDYNILGKIFEEGKIQLDLTKKFYQGDKKTKEEVKELMKKSQHIHFTGKSAVALGVEKDYINPEHILYVKNIPHAETVFSE